MILINELLMPLSEKERKEDVLSRSHSVDLRAFLFSFSQRESYVSITLKILFRAAAFCTLLLC